MSQPHPPASGSCRTSVTFFESPDDKPEIKEDRSPSPNMHIAQICSHGEENFERYGGDDIHEPPPKELIVGGQSPSLTEESTLDENMVTWDGSDDPINPQNWSIKYKWLITAICIVMTINVYVLTFLLALVFIKTIIIQNLRIFRSDIGDTSNHEAVSSISRDF